MEPGTCSCCTIIVVYTFVVAYTFVVVNTFVVVKIVVVFVVDCSSYCGS